MRDAVRGARAAFVFLTRLPVGGGPYSPGAWRWSPAWFPLVGLVLGAVQGAAFALAARAGSLVAACVAVAVALLLTGAFHEDGLADTADALGGSHDREKLFAILKDSRIGAFGAAALTMALLLRVALLARLGAAAPAALVAVQCASRLAPVALMAFVPYVTPHGRSKSGHVAGAGGAQAVVATTVTLAALAALSAAGAIARVEAAGVLAAGSLAAFACGARFVARAGGLTGDFLGATQQVAECAMLLAVAVLHG
jgi:adenosylcobinamide-GDP ribazoletransferase